MGDALGIMQHWPVLKSESDVKLYILYSRKKSGLQTMTHMNSWKNTNGDSKISDNLHFFFLVWGGE